MAFLPPAGDLAHPASYLSFFAAILATGLGAPVPEDAVVLAGGYLVYRGLTAMGPTLALAMVGVVLGDVAIYFIGRGFGGAMLHSHFVARLVSPEQLLGRYGVMAVFVSRFLMGVRAGVYVTAGALRMPSHTSLPPTSPPPS